MTMKNKILEIVTNTRYREWTYRIVGYGPASLFDRIGLTQAKALLDIKRSWNIEYKLIQDLRPIAKSKVY